MRKLRIAIAGLTSCSGCQLSLLNCEDELPELLERFEFHYFPLASSPALLSGKYDAALVEGCLSMPDEQELLLELRKLSLHLIALGTCAIWGGVAALRNGEDRGLLRQSVYGENQNAYKTFEPLPLNRIVQVDAVVSGCPPEKEELLKLLAGLLHGILPAAIDYPVCNECKMRENLCLLMDQNKLCLGYLTIGGCKARCPTLAVPCEGCRGPVPEANMAESLKIYALKEFDLKKVTGRLSRFSTEWESCALKTRSTY